jgi:peptidoglycan/LPS O-acetylase OafA/YrhL
MLSVSIFRCIYGFFIGHLTYLLWSRRKNRTPALEWLALGLSVAIVSFGEIKPLQFIAPLIFAFAVWVFAGESGLLSRLAKSPMMQMLGAWSYSIYMTHLLGIHILISILAWMDARFGMQAMKNIWTGDAAALLFLAAVVLLSSATYRYIENPARNYFNKLANGSAVPVSKGSSLV